MALCSLYTFCFKEEFPSLSLYHLPNVLLDLLVTLVSPIELVLAAYVVNFQ